MVWVGDMRDGGDGDGEPAVVEPRDGGGEGGGVEGWRHGVAGVPRAGENRAATQMFLLVMGG